MAPRLRYRLRYKFYLAKRGFWFLFYYGFARHLPCSYSFGRLGRLAKALRAYACRRLFQSAGRNINVEHGAQFDSGGCVEIGDNSGIGVNCRIPGALKIGNNVMMGPEVIILNQNHRIDRIDIPMMVQGRADLQPVVIEDDVWIGTRVILLPGVTIGRGTVIGAGAVVSKSVPAYSICAGNPARVIRSRLPQVQLTANDGQVSLP